MKIIEFFLKKKKHEREEWKVRYDIALEIAKQEYLLQIERIKNIDEKIEKFLIVAAALIAALVAILGNLNNILSIYQKNESCANFILNIIIVLLIIYSLYISFDTLNNFLKGLEIKETRRMPSTIELINDPKEASLEWTYVVIEFYDEARKFLDKVSRDKITYLSKGQASLRKQAIAIFLVIVSTFIKSIFLKD